MRQRFRALEAPYIDDLCVLIEDEIYEQNDDDFVLVDIQYSHLHDEDGGHARAYLLFNEIAEEEDGQEMDSSDEDEERCAPRRTRRSRK